MASEKLYQNTWNRRFPGYPKHLFQSEAKSGAIDIKMVFLNSQENKTHFDMKGFALSLSFESENLWISEMAGK